MKTKARRILLTDLPWKGKKYAGRAGMRWAHTSDKEDIVSFRPFPFYLACTAALLEKHGHTVIIVDALAEKLSEQEFFRRVKEFNPDFIVAEIHTPSYNNDCHYMRELKKLTQADMIFAGPHPTALAHDVLKENRSAADFVIVGEYEFSTLDVVEGKHKKGIVMRKEPVNIDEIPWPARHLFKMNLYNEVFCRDYPNIQMMASRGCPLQCSYCNIYLMNLCRKQRCRDVNDVVKEMKHVIDKYHPKEIYFDDDNIDVSREWLTKLMEAKIRNKIKMPFTCMGHLSIPGDLLELMRKAGCRGMKFGVESADNNILKRLKKGLTVEIAEATIRKCRQLGIKTHLTYCIGLPGDTEETIKKTIRFAKSHGDSYQISLAAPFPGTPLYEEAKRNGWLHFKSWDEFDGMKDAIISYPTLSSKKLFKMYKDAQEFTYLKAIKSGEWLKYIRMIYQERGIKGLFKLFFIRGPKILKEALFGK